MVTVRTLFDAALARVDAGAAVRRALVRDGRRILVGPLREDFTPPAGGRVFVAAVGKAAEQMAGTASGILGDLLAGGVGIAKQVTGAPTGAVAMLEGGHPIPDERGLRASRRLHQLLTATRPSDLLLLLVSGGGSALLTMPAPELTLADLRLTTDLLLRAGADIGELNTVRKHLELLKGGRLATMTSARIVALVVSDVLGDPLDVIASGPAVGDASTYRDALAILVRRQLLDAVPPSVSARLRAGLRGEVPETPAPDDPGFERVTSYIIANLPLAAAGLADRAQELGYAVDVLDLAVEGEAREVGAALGWRARELARENGAPRCLIGGGETTVTVTGSGLGGRNTEVALAAALELDGAPGVAVASLATDGDDGATGSAGAVVTSATMERARRLGLEAGEFLRRNDSGTFFKEVGGLLRTGPTGTNVADLHLTLVDGKTGANCSSDQRRAAS